jgi:hypothetical protein
LDNSLPSGVIATKSLFDLNAGMLRYGISANPWRRYECENAPNVVYAYREVGKRSYECKDHLGNVRAVVSDLRRSTVVAGVITAYATDVKAWSDYFAYYGSPKK